MLLNVIYWWSRSGIQFFYVFYRFAYLFWWNKMIFYIIQVLYKVHFFLQLPWKSLKSIVEYYYMWKTTDRYVQQKRIKAAEAESKLKQVYIPN